MMHQCAKPFIRALFAVLLLSAPARLIAGVIWDGGGADNKINTPANWDLDMLPDFDGSASKLVFSGNTRLTPEINVDIKPLSLRFDAEAGPFAIGGAATITTGTTGTTNGDIINDSAVTQRIDASLLMRRGALNAAAGDLVINGTINVGGGSSSSGRSLTIQGDHDVFLNGPIEGTGTSTSSGGVISKVGNGVWHITSNSPAWAGRIGIDVGVLRISATDALGDPNSRTLVQTGGSTGKSRLELAGNIVFAPERLELTGRDIGASPVHLSNFSGNNTWTGNSVLRTGGAEYGFDSAAGKLTITGDILNETGNATARTIRFSGAGNGEFAALFVDSTGTGALTIRKEGTGTWIFSNPSFSYLGDTLVSGGTLAFTGGISIDSSPHIEIAPGATLDLSSGSLNRAAEQTLVGAGTARGPVSLAGGVLTPDVPGMVSSPATLTFADGLSLDGGNVNFDLGATQTPGGGVNDLVNVQGNLQLLSQTDINLHPLAGGLASGAYRLFNYSGAIVGDPANLKLSFPATRQSLLIDTSTAQQVNLLVSGAPADLVWAGDGGGNAWDVNTSTNWRAGQIGDRFFNLDDVTFSDAADPGNTAVALDEAVYPSSVTVDSSLDYSISGSGGIRGVTGLAKSGTGTLTIDTDNDNTGDTIINAGAVQVGAGSDRGSLGSGNIVNNGLLVFNRSKSLTVSGAISGSGSLEKIGGTLTLAANNSYAGTTTIQSGTLQIGNGGTTGSIGPGDVINDGVLAIDRDSDLVMGNVIVGNGEINKQGTGFLTLTGDNTYVGPTTINGSSTAGGLVIDNLADGGVSSNIGASAADAANLHIRTNGTLRYVGAGAATDRLFTIGNARIDSSGSGPLVFTNTGAIATSGGNRTLLLLGNNTGDNRLTPSIADSGPAGVTSFEKQGEGTWVLAGDNTFTGAAVVRSGVLKLASASALGAIEPLPENTNSAGTTIIGDVGGSGRIVLSGDLVYDAEALTLQARQGPTADIPHLTNAGGTNHWTGPITLTTGGFEYTLQSDAGTLVIDADIMQSATTLERFLNLQGDGDGAINGIIVNGGNSQVQSLRKRGAGTWTLNSANMYIGTTSVEGGVLRIGATGSIATENDVAVAGGATFDVGGAASVAKITGAGRTLVGNVGAPAATLSADLIRQAALLVGRGSRVTLAADGGTSVVGELTIPFGGPAAPGTLDINDNRLIVDYGDGDASPESLVRLHIMTGRGGTGFGATWTGNGITSSAAAGAVSNEPESRSIGYAENASLPLGPYSSFGGQSVDGTSLLIAYARTGDANLDGVVNDDDITIVSATYAPAVPQPSWALGDFDYNGFVDDDDITLLGAFYDPAAAPLAVARTGGTPAASVVPEPAGALLVLVAVANIGLFCRQRRRAKRPPFANT
jgi:autotransporter-associated beta strand protein